MGSVESCAFVIITKSYFDVVERGTVVGDDLHVNLHKILTGLSAIKKKHQI